MAKFIVIILAMKADKNKQAPFAGRQGVLDTLNKYAQDSLARLVLIHGRRRVGKTRLIHELTKNKDNVFYFTGVELTHAEKQQGCAQKTQIKNFLETLSQIVHKEVYAQIEPSSWLRALKLLDECLPTDDSPCFVVLDELPWMASHRLEIVRALFTMWESHWNLRRHFMLIICGSSVGFLHQHFIKSTQFYGRASLNIHLSPLTLFDSVTYFGNKRSFDELINLYMVFGGIPKYFEQISHQESVYKTINNLCFTPNGFFVDEMNLLLKSSFLSDSNKYRKTLKTLTQKNFLSYDALAKATKSTKGSSFKHVLGNLIASDLVERLSSVHKHQTSNLYQFRLSDEFSRFFYSFMEPRLLDIKQNKMGSDLFSKVLPERKYYTWKGRCFERLVQKHAHLIAAKTGIDFVTERFGTFFTRAQNEPQIDLLYVRTDKTITACEIKCSENPVVMTKELAKQIQSQKDFLQTIYKNHRIEHWLITNAPIGKNIAQSDLIQKTIVLGELM